MSSATRSAAIPAAASSTAGPWRPIRQKSEPRSRRRPAATVSSSAMEESRRAGLDVLQAGHSLPEDPLLLMLLTCFASTVSLRWREPLLVLLVLQRRC